MTHNYISDFYEIFHKYNTCDIIELDGINNILINIYNGLSDGSINPHYLHVKEHFTNMGTLVCKIKYNLMDVILKLCDFIISSPVTHDINVLNSVLSLTIKIYHDYIKNNIIIEDIHKCRVALFQIFTYFNFRLVYTDDGMNITIKILHFVSDVMLNLMKSGERQFCCSSQIYKNSSYDGALPDFQYLIKEIIGKKFLCCEISEKIICEKLEFVKIELLHNIEKLFKDYKIFTQKNIKEYLIPDLTNIICEYLW